MQNDWWTPSGSRWEPVPEVATRASLEATLPVEERAEPRRTDRLTHRRTTVALLLTLLGAGAVSAGVAYAQSDGAAAGRPLGPPSSQVAGGSDHGGRHAHGPHGASS